MTYIEKEKILEKYFDLINNAMECGIDDNKSKISCIDYINGATDIVNELVRILDKTEENNDARDFRI